MEAEHLAVQINQSRINNISYNSGNVIITLSRHFQSYSGFSNIQPCLGMRDVKAYSGIFKHY